MHGDYLALARARLAHAAPQLVLLDHARETAAASAAAPGTNAASSLDAQQQLPIFSFLVRWAPAPNSRNQLNGPAPGGRFLHFNFVCALLNDLFGVQARGGCQCAGPYSQQLLGLGGQANAALEERLLVDKAEVLRPGYSRLSLPYALSKVEVEFAVAALCFVAQQGYLFLPQYVLNAKTGECKHRSRATKTLTHRKWLSHFSLGDAPTPAPAPLEAADGADTDAEGAGEGSGWGQLEEGALAARLSALVADAEVLAAAEARALRSGKGGSWAGSGASLLPGASETLRWFVYPSEVEAALKQAESGNGEPAAYAWAPAGPVQPPAMGILRGSPPVQSEETASTAAPAAARASSASAPSPPPGSVGYGEKPGHVKYPARPADAPPAPALWHHPAQVHALLPPAAAAAAAAAVATGAGAAAAGADTAAATAIAGGIAVRLPDGPPLAASAGSASGTFHGVRMPSTAAAPAGSSPSGRPAPKKARVDASATAGPSPVPTAPAAELGAAAAAPAASALAARSGSSGPPGAKGKLPVPPKKLMRLVGQAIRDWRMVADGDRLVVGLSGGKDSLTLLFALLDLQRRAPVKFTIAAATV